MEFAVVRFGNGYYYGFKMHGGSGYLGLEAEQLCTTSWMASSNFEQWQKTSLWERLVWAVALLSKFMSFLYASGWEC